MNILEICAELAAINERTEELTERTRLIMLLVEKYQHRDDIEAELINVGIGIELKVIKSQMVYMNERTLFIQEMLGLGE